MVEYLQVSTATPTQDTAVDLAKAAVQARLAASAQIVGPAVSVFWHRGEFGTGEEWILLLKTTAGRWAALEQLIVASHPWDNPEITAVPLAEGSAAYLQWVRRTVAEG